jgi:hypothetical protein
MADPHRCRGSSGRLFDTIFPQFGTKLAHAETSSTSVGSLPVQDIRLNRGDNQITNDFIGYLKSFAVSGPSIDPAIDKCASMWRSRLSGGVSQRSRLI